MHCYACRKDKPADHIHFQHFGATAMRPPNRTLPDIAAEWGALSEGEQVQALTDARRMLASAARHQPGRSAGKGSGWLLLAAFAGVLMLPFAPGIAGWIGERLVPLDAAPME